MRRALRLLIQALFLLAAASRADVLIEIGGRSVNVHVPPSYSPLQPAPVVMLLHGYGGSGAGQESYMHFEGLSDQEGFLYLHPDGTLDCTTPPKQFWNATDACCNFCGTPVDDVAFLSAVLDEVEAQFSVDPRRIYLIGHSNGGFMSYRMACALANRIAAIASLAGATWADPLACNPSESVHILQIHGTSDATILYAGGLILGVPYPGAVASAETWATYNGCGLTPDTSAPMLDLDSSLPGNETSVARYESGCSEDGSAELWTIGGGLHIPALSSSFSSEVVGFLLAHPKAAVAVPLLHEPLWLAVALLVAAVAFACSRGYGAGSRQEES